MKRNFYGQTVLFSIAAAMTIAACDNAPKGDNAIITEEQKATEATGMSFIVDTTDSKIRFTGNGVGKNHPGKFKVSSGNIALSNNQVTGGEFTIDINSMEMEEKGEVFRDKLRPHLLSGDFFDAEKFGTAKFEITAVSPYEKNDKDTSIIKGANFNVSGNLTIKNETKNITFPAKIDLDGNTLKAKANFDIDRRQWQMNYGNDKTLGDKFISETVNVELDIEAEAQTAQK
ncbi:MAG: YceI family protein [Bacteroidota bacterium]|nr:YceI family protein [Bacteroidota bacterium]